MSPLVASSSHTPSRGSVIGRGVLLSVAAGVAHAVRLAVGDDGGVMQESVKDADGGGVLGEGTVPISRTFLGAQVKELAGNAAAPGALFRKTCPVASLAWARQTALVLDEAVF